MTSKLSRFLERTTFEKTDYWIKKVRKVKGEESVLMLVGNKADLSEER